MPNKAQISNYFYPDKLSVFIPYTVNQRGIRRQHPVSGDHAGAARSGDSAGARAAGEPPPVQPTRHARRECSRYRRYCRDDRRHHRGAAVRPLFHRHADADDRRRRCDEHHARVGNGAHEGDWRAEGARREAAAHPHAVSARSADDHLPRRRHGHRAVVSAGVGHRHAAVPRDIARRSDEAERTFSSCCRAAFW